MPGKLAAAPGISCCLWRFGKRRHGHMRRLSISLPEPLVQFVDGQVAAGRYSSVSEYVRQLISADEKRKAEEQLDARLSEDLGSAERELLLADGSAIRGAALARAEA